MNPSLMKSTQTLPKGLRGNPHNPDDTYGDIRYNNPRG